MAKGRIGKDPNNTRWTKDTTTFGHRILRSHGWTPGSFLGAENAPHAELHSAASASYIRVAMKDDAGGLGFRPGQSSDNDIAGLDEVKGIFDRLNGVVETEAAREARERRKAMAYLGQRLGGVAFISGGFLEQEGWDKVDELVKAEVVEEVLVVDGEEAPRKKRRRDGTEKADKKARKEERRKRKEKSVESESSPADSSSSSDDDEASPAPKSSKRQKSAQTPSNVAPETKSERRERREARSLRKEERRLRRERKEEKRRERLLKSGGDDLKSKKKRKKSAAEIEAIVTGTSTPVDSDAPARTRTGVLGGRHIHHARKVAAKNSAMSNATVLAQILAI